MLFGLLGSKPVLDEVTIQWMRDTFAWARKNFEARVFDEETILVTPSNAHFPGRSDSPQDMAEMILQQVKQHAGAALAGDSLRVSDGHSLRYGVVWNRGGDDEG